MSKIILHHYPQSPVAEKVRKCFGIKKIEWWSVEENRLPPRPELFAMTGGYRRIPVLQIGADIYCDTQCIIRELEIRTPEPTLFPIGIGGIPYGLSRWTDDELFSLAFKAVIAPVAETLPTEFVADRARLYLGPDHDIAKEAADIPHTLAQLRSMMGWVEKRFETNASFILGDAPGMPDLAVWYVVWFLRARFQGAAEFFKEFPAINSWAERMEALGYGQSNSLSGEEALAIAREAQPTSLSQQDPNDPQGLQPGMAVAITPLTESGESAIHGTLRAVNKDTLALTMMHDDCGETVVHFPRVGYRVTVAQ